MMSGSPPAFTVDSNGVSDVAIGVAHFLELLNLQPDVDGETSTGKDFEDKLRADEKANGFLLEEQTIDSDFNPPSSSNGGSFGLADKNPLGARPDGH